jgi:hypothetical protein
MTKREMTGLIVGCNKSGCRYADQGIGKRPHGTAVCYEFPNLDRVDVCLCCGGFDTRIAGKWTFHKASPDDLMALLVGTRLGV